MSITAHEAANNAFKTRGFRQMSFGLVGVCLSGIGEGGAGSIVYAKIMSDTSEERRNVVKHFAKYKNISTSDVIIKH